MQSRNRAEMASLVAGIVSAGVSVLLFLFVWSEQDSSVVEVAGAFWMLWLVSLIPGVIAIIVGVMSLLLKSGSASRATAGILLGLSPVLFPSYYVGIPEYRRRADPCRYEDRTILVNRYPELGALLERGQVQENEMVARHKTLLPPSVYESVTVYNLETKRGTITAEQALEIRRQHDEWIELVKEQNREFRRLCQRLVR